MKFGDIWEDGEGRWHFRQRQDVRGRAVPGGNGPSDGAYPAETRENVGDQRNAMMNRWLALGCSDGDKASAGWVSEVSKAFRAGSGRSATAMCFARYQEALAYVKNIFSQTSSKYLQAAAAAAATSRWALTGRSTGNRCVLRPGPGGGRLKRSSRSWRVCRQKAVALKGAAASPLDLTELRVSSSAQLSFGLGSGLRPSSACGNGTISYCLHLLLPLLARHGLRVPALTH